MTSKEIRRQFLSYFKSREHEIVASAPIVIKNDPTLMFTNAGMNQFKDIFLGNSPIKHPRIANTQKCLRVSGKHNDLEEVGVDTYHHTMFEMLGNWSFGDYFKKEAISWAWELLTKVYKIDPQNLYITVFEGDKKDGLEEDTEAINFWKEHVAEDRILQFDRKDNFWEMGDTGPCGPCSEIHIDLRDTAEKKKTPGSQLVNKDNPEVIEIWNLVFMEFNRKQDGSLEPLPNKHIDTGMGFERLCTVLQNKKSNYDSDVFSPLIQKIETLTGKKYEASSDKKDVAFRVISDHVRAVAFAIADGQLPSNSGSGYVIRRILRRAIRYSFSFLEMKNPFIFNLVEVLKEQMTDTFPELNQQAELIVNVIREEEESFLKTLEKGITRIHSKLKETSNGIIDGRTVFELYDTYGFPVDLTALIAQENNHTIDEKEFQLALNEQKSRSRQAGEMQIGDWIVLKEDDKEEFVGYDHWESTVQITRYREVKIKSKKQFQLVFNLTPFYPEGGGQVGDRGVIFNESEKIKILDTQKENNVIIHKCLELPKNLKVNFTASVNREYRMNTMKNHSATHLLHYSLRKHLGEHVQQKGSLVNQDHLRFDFSHFSKVEFDLLNKIEDEVNAMIRHNIQLNEQRNLPMTEAKDKGAIALFGEKYGDVVRVIQFDESIELCGGTHVQNTGEIGWFKLITESAVAAGVRRIEAITAEKAQSYVREKLQQLEAVNQLLKQSGNPVKAIEELQFKNQVLSKSVEKLNAGKAVELKSELENKVENISGINFLVEQVELDAKALKDLAFQLKDKFENFYMVLGNLSKGKPSLTVVVSENLVDSKNMNASTIVRELAKEIDGGGGGQAYYATAGGKNASGLPSALVKAKSFLK